MNPRPGGPDRRPQPFRSQRPTRPDRSFGSDRPPGRPDRPDYRPPAPGAGRPPGPAGYAGSTFNAGGGYGRPPARPVKERLTFRPDGTSEVNLRTERGPRPGRSERDSIRRGDRPFWSGNAAAGAAPDSRDSSNRPGPESSRGGSGGGYRGSSPQRPAYGAGPGRERERESDPGQGPNWSPRPSGPRPPYGGGYGNPRPRGYEARPDTRTGDRPGSRPSHNSGGPRPDRTFARPAFRPPGAPPSTTPRPPTDDDEEDRLEPRAAAPRRPARPAEPRPFYEQFIRRKPQGSGPSTPRAAGVASERPSSGTPKPKADTKAKPARPESASSKPARTNPKPAPEVRAALKAAAAHARDKASTASADGGTPRTVPEIIARILSKIGPDLPADAALRQELKRRRSLAPEAAAHISLSIFRHFRWLGWLNPESTPELRVAQANTLAEQFSNRPDSIPDEELLARTVPAWVREAMDFDLEWLRAIQREPSLWLRTRADYEPALISRFASGDLGPLSPGPLPQSYSYGGTVDLFRLKEFQEGQFEIQDVASQAVGHLCDPKPGEIWWDTCAGEGGKTLHLADLMGNRGLIYSTDRADWRLARLRERAGRAECFNYRAAHWDGGERPPTQSQFDGVLVDAPCSGLGTWGKNPHARWTTTLQDVTELAAVQHSMLRNVAPSVKLGGRLVYAVCTLTRAETTAVAEAFAQAHPDFEPIPLRHPFAPSAEPTGNQVTLWPQQTGGNGMFVAAWKRVRAAMVSPKP